MEAVKIEKYPNLSDSKVSWYLVKRDGVVVGLLEKWRDTRTETHPWKAWGLVPKSAPVATPNPFHGAFYKADGYKTAAVNAVLANAV